LAQTTFGLSPVSYRALQLEFLDQVVWIRWARKSR